MISDTNKIQKQIEKKINISDIVSRIKKETGVSPKLSKKSSKKRGDIVDIITFCEGRDHLSFLDAKPPMLLTLVQRIILKCFYAGSEGNEDLQLTQQERDWLINWQKDKPKDKQLLIDLVLDKHDKRQLIVELILVLGRRSGKCRNKDDIISTTIGSITFRELLERKLNGEKIGILTYDDDLKKSLTYDFEIWDNGVKDCAKLKTKRGIQEISSLNHPYLVWRDNKEKYEFIRLDQLKKGDRVAIAKSTDLFGKDPIGEDKCKILGRLLGNDRSIRNGIADFPNDEDWISSLGLLDTNSRTKFIPSCVLKAPRSEVVAFLSELFSTNGRVVRVTENKRSGKATYCSFSEGLVCGARHLLQKFGVHSSVRTRYKNTKKQCYALTISDHDSIEKFEKEIFTDQASETSDSRYASDSHALKNIPLGVWKHISQTPNGNRLKNKRCPSSDMILEYGNSINDDFLVNVGNSDVYWDRVEMVEPVGKKETVDLTVHGTHVIGGDIISHNTLLASIVATYEAYKCLELYNPQEYFGLAPDNQIIILNIATASPQAKLLYNEIKARIRHSTYFTDKFNQESSSEEYTYLLTQYDKDTNDMLRSQNRNKELIKGSIIIQCGHSNSNSLMGSGIICLIFDELAYFNDGAGKSGGQKVYGDLVPNTKAFKHPDGSPAARIVQISAPAGKSGVFYQNFRTSLTPEGYSMLSFQFPTWDCSPIIKSKDDLATEFKKNPQEAMVRYGAEFSGSLSTTFFPEDLVERANDLTLFNKEKGLPHIRYYAHVDPALTNHNYAFVILHEERYMDTETREKKRKIVVDHVQKWVPIAGKEVNLLDVENYILNICKRFNIVSITFDEWNSANSVQKFRRMGLPVKRTPFRSSYKQLIFAELRDLAIGGDLKLLPDEYLIGEFKNLQYKITARGFRVFPDLDSEYPTDDYVDCVAGAAHMSLTTGLRELPQTVTTRNAVGLGGRMLSMFSGTPQVTYGKSQ